MIKGCKVDESKKVAERTLSETKNCWADMQNLLDVKKQSLLAKQKEVEHYMKLSNQLCNWMSNVGLKLEQPQDLVGDPHKMTDKLDEMKVTWIYTYIAI